jgi:hypothetical protein
MRQWFLCGIGALLLSLAAPCFAQPMGDQQHPEAYNDDQSQPLRILSYFMSPVGYVFEHGIARPFHYLATQTFLAPVLNGGDYDRQSGTPPSLTLPQPDQIVEDTTPPAANAPAGRPYRGAGKTSKPNTGLPATSVAPSAEGERQPALR